MRRIRRRKSQKTLLFYLTASICVVSLVFFFSIGYAILKEELNVRGTTSLNIAGGPTTCDINSAPSNAAITYTLNSWGSQGQIVLSATNPLDVTTGNYIIFLKKPAGTTITINESESAEAEITDNLIIYRSTGTWPIRPSEQVSYYWGIEFEEGATGALEEGEYKAYFSENEINLQCINNKWVLNDEIIDEPTEENRLSNLVVDNYTLNPSFNSDTYNYSLTVPNDVNSVNITATPIDSEDTVTISGNENLIEGKNNVKIKVTGNEGGEKVYTIEINKLGLIEDNDYNPDYASQGIELVNNANYSSQYYFVLTNNKTQAITNWKIHLDVGTGKDYSSWSSNWSGVNYSYNATTGVLTLSFGVFNSDMSKIIEPGGSIKINGDAETGQKPVVLGVTYEVVE